MVYVFEMVIYSPDLIKCESFVIYSRNNSYIAYLHVINLDK
jgi:hypothetical protein